MLGFSRPEYLLIVIVLFFVYLFARRSRQWLVQPSRRQTIRSSFVSRCILTLPLFFWFTVGTILAVALANPRSEKKQTFVSVERFVLVVSIDASTSMGKGEGSTMETIRAMAKDFVQLRSGDAIGISAYSGKRSRGRGKGYARILMYPTEDMTLTMKAIDSVHSRMFGAYTAIGDGIFVSILAVISSDAYRIMGDEYNRNLLEKSVDTYGTDKEDLSYAQKVAEAVGSQAGKFIVLFTDGKYNTGMNPSKAIWFANRLGMRVHFVAFESSSATGLSVKEQVERKAETIRAVIGTGGMYRESSDIEALPAIFNEIDKAERARFLIEDEPRFEDHRDKMFIMALIAFLLWIAAENIWIKIP